MLSFMENPFDFIIIPIAPPMFNPFFLSGGIFLIWADVVARILIANTEIPLGVITSAIGAPIFVYMMVRRSYGFGGKD